MEREETRRGIQIDGVWDIETEDWDRFVVGGLLLADGRYIEKTWRQERAFAEAILSTPGTLWAHNGGAFDTKWLLGWCLKLGVKANVIVAGARVVRLNAGEVEILDSYALTKVSLADFTKGTGVEKAKTGLRCVCKQKCGGYCSIKRGMPKEEFAKLRSYLRRDCESLIHSLRNLSEWATKPEVDIDLCATVGGSAFRNARRLLKLPDASLQSGDHAFVRRGYFGGRVQVFRPFSESGREYDVASMYPSRLAYCAVPVGPHERIYGRFAAHSFEMRQPGFYRCQVEVPESFVPPLPARVSKPVPRVCYPWGTLGGVWALPELEYAESLGCKVRPIEAVVWEREEVVFKPWIERLFALRAGAPGGKKSPIGTFLKFYLNSLTGKFGSKPEGWRIIVNPDEIKTCRCEDPSECDGLCGGHHPLDDGGLIVRVGRWHIGPECHVEFAGYLTSHARVEWHREAVSAHGGEDLVYCDTDSMYVEGERTRNLGSELGRWEFQGRYFGMQIRAPKVYKFDRWFDADGKACEPGKGRLGVVVKAKGVPLPRVKAFAPKVADRKLERAWKSIEEMEALKGSGIVGLGKGARAAEFFKKSELSRRINVGFGDRVYSEADGKTYPLNARDLAPRE